MLKRVKPVSIFYIVINQYLIMLDKNLLDKYVSILYELYHNDSISEFEEH